MTFIKASSLPGTYKPTLDGWRAASIVAVVLYHDRIHSIGQFSTAALHSHGNLGVDLFFAISGYLIVSRLLEEEETWGLFSSKEFYLRRAYRILPPALCYIGVVSVLALAGVLPATWQGVAAATLFLRNYYNYYHHAPANWFLGHFWSLSLEEQFYLFVPALLMAFKTTLLRASALLMATLGFFCWSWTHPDTTLRVYGILFASCLAVLLRVDTARALMERYLHPLSVCLVTLVIGYVFRSHWGFASHLLLFVFTPLILSTVLHPSGWLSVVLESAPLRWIGRRSYSLYLWQQFFFIDERIAPVPPYTWMNRAPWSYLGLIACACASYSFVEQPMVRLGHRVRKRAAHQAQSASYKE